MAIVREFDCLLDFRGVFFHLEARYMSDELFTLSFLSPDFTERWYGEFSSEHIEDVTHRAGALKKLSTFWKMLCTAGFKQSKSVSLEIVLPSAFLETLATVSEDKIYIVLTQFSEFDRVKFPLRLLYTEFTLDELKATIRRLYADNLRLKEQPVLPRPPDPREGLERRVAQLNEELARMQSAKDDEIEFLEQKLQELSSTALRPPELPKRPRTSASERALEPKSPKPRQTRKFAKTPK